MLLITYGPEKKREGVVSITQIGTRGAAGAGDLS